MKNSGRSMIRPAAQTRMRGAGVALAVLVASALPGCGPDSDAVVTGELETPAETGTNQGAIREGVVDMYGVPTPIQYTVLDGQALFEGDILLDLDEDGIPRGETSEVDSTGQELSVIPVRRLWPEGRIVYALDAGLKEPDRVTQAIRHWEEKTSIRFVKRTNEKDYALIRQGQPGVCNANVGRRGGMQTVNLGDGCDVSTAIHELGHVIGLWHEQSRHDRDAHIDIVWENIMPGHEHNFSTTGEPLGPYDSSSIMHYHSTSYSRNGLPTLLRKDGSHIPDARELSVKDIESIGRIYAARPTCVVSGAIRTRWVALGGEKGGLGRCITSERTSRDGKGRYNHFEGGSIYWTPKTGARAVTGSIRDTWAILGWENGRLGYPTSDEAFTASKKAVRQQFEGGTIYRGLSGPAFELRGAIKQRWEAAGGEVGPMGLPTSNERAGPGGGSFSEFKNGVISWSPKTGTHFVKGAILTRWRELGGAGGALGYPRSDEYAVPGGAQTDFEGGSIKWTSATGSLSDPFSNVGGAIGTKWRQLGAEKGELGRSITTEQPAGAGEGRYQDFVNGSIYWSPDSGAHLVKGLLRTWWRSYGAENSPYGYPVSDEYAIEGGARSDFQGGSIWVKDGKGYAELKP